MVMHSDSSDVPKNFHIIKVDLCDYGPLRPVYKAGQRCKHCRTTILSIYTPLDVCNICQNKKINEILKQIDFLIKKMNGKPVDMCDFTVTHTALQLLKAKQRKPLRALSEGD